MSYSEKLKDPRWQKKRLEILDRDEWRCTECGSKDKTLTVHHGYYEKDKEPWEYDGETLRTLCEGCHEETHEILSYLRKDLGALPLVELRACGKWIQSRTRDREEDTVPLRSDLAAALRARLIKDLARIHGNLASMV